MSTSTNEIQPLLSLDDLSDVLGVPKGTIYQWRKKGYGPKACKVGGALRYRPADVDQWLQERQEDHVGDVAS